MAKKPKRETLADLGPDVESITIITPQAEVEVQNLRDTDCEAIFETILEYTDGKLRPRE